MKRLMPASLINFLQTNRNCLKADLFSIALPTGQTLNVTDGQWDITLGSETAWNAQANALAPWWTTSDVFVNNNFSLSTENVFRYFAATGPWNPSQMFSSYGGGSATFIGSPRTVSGNGYTFSTVVSVHYDATPAEGFTKIGMGTGALWASTDSYIGFIAPKTSGSGWGNWQLVMGDGVHSATVIDSGVAIADTPGADITLGVRTELSYTIDDNGVTWYINGVSVGNTSTNIPTAALGLTYLFESGSYSGSLYSRVESISYQVGGSLPGWGNQQVTFSATQYGRWSRGNVTSEAGFNFASNTMALTVAPQINVTYPGLGVGILNAIMNGLFDAATVTVYTVYMPIGQYGNVSAGVETKFFGTITKVVSVSRTHGEFECADPLYILNMKVPTRLIQTNCPWSFADSNCNVSGGAAAFTTTFAADGTSTVWTLVPTSAFTGKFAATDAFVQGVVTCTSGANAGLSQTVEAQSGSDLAMSNKWLLPIAAGDTFSIIMGCDKTLPTCIAKFNNAQHHAGLPYTPVPTTAL